MTRTRILTTSLAIMPLVVLVLSLATPVFADTLTQSGTPSTPAAQSGTPSTPAAQSGTGLTSPLKDSDLSSLLNDILGFVITIGGIAVVLMLVFVGFKFVAAQGNASALEEARTMLMWTVIGALVLLGAKAIEAGIQATVSTLSS